MTVVRMSEPSDLAGESRSGTDAEFDRSAHPALGPFFAGLDDLATPPPDADVRLQHISRAAATAAASRASGQPTPWRTVGWRVAAVAAGMAVVVGGLGADDRLPAPAQRMVSSFADALGVDLPDGSDRSTGRDEDHDGPGAPEGRDTNRSSDRSESTPHDRRQDVPRATPAEPGDPGEPATPAVPADPEKPETPEHPDAAQPETPDAPPERPEPTPSSTAPPPPASPPSNPTGADGSGNADEHSDGNAAEPAPRSGPDAAPDDDRGRKSENSPSNP